MSLAEHKPLSKRDDDMKVIIAAGGTGGHFYPGLAVARELIQSGSTVSFIIKKGDYVLPLLEREKIPFVAISAGGFKRSLHPKNILAVLKLIQGFFQAFRFLLKEKPSTLLVMGGYLSVPPALAAWILKIPVFLHEQNVLPGLANRCLSRLASRVAVSFPESLPVFGTKAILTGNPVRREFLTLPDQGTARKKWNLDPSKLTILIFGGSLGAHRLNQLVIEAIEQLPLYADRFQILHITGASDVTWAQSRYEKTPFRHYVDSYCHDMPSAYAASDLVIARSGASTVSELMVVKKPALFVPYPLATGGHQTANAKVLADRGAARIYEQKDLSNGELKVILEGHMAQPSEWQSWIGSMGTLPVDPAASAVVIARMMD